MIRQRGAIGALRLPLVRLDRGLCVERFECRSRREELLPDAFAQFQLNDHVAVGRPHQPLSQKLDAHEAAKHPTSLRGRHGRRLYSELRIPSRSRKSPRFLQPLTSASPSTRSAKNGFNGVGQRRALRALHPRAGGIEAGPRGVARNDAVGERELLVKTHQMRTTWAGAAFARVRPCGVAMTC